MIQVVENCQFLEDIMSKKLTVLAFGVLLAFSACEKKQDEKKEEMRVTVENDTPATTTFTAPAAVPIAPEPATATTDTPDKKSEY